MYYGFDMKSFHEENLAWTKALSTLDRLAILPVDETWFVTWSNAMKPCSAAYLLSLYRHYQNIDDEQAKAHYTYVRQELQPQLEARYRKLATKAIAWKPTDERYARILKRLNLETATENANTSQLEAQVSTICDTYTRTVTKQHVLIDAPLTMQTVVARINSEPEGKKRRHLWLEREKRLAEDYNTIDGLFLKAVGLRREIAKSAGAKNYLEYSWLDRYRTDYTPGDTISWLHDLQIAFSGIQQRFSAYLAARLKVDKLRPWDQDVIQTRSGGNHRFDEAGYLYAIESAFGALSPNFAIIVRDMIRKGHIDLMNRPNKAGGNFATVLTPQAEPLVSCNGTGSLGDLRVMLHETGHAVHYALSSRKALSFEAFPRQEICEFAAYTFQTLTSEYLVSNGTMNRAERGEFNLFVISTVLQKFRNIEGIERFQHWLYTQEEVPSVEALDEAWSGFQTDQGVEWSAHEEYRNKGWQQPLIFCQPFYSIEYVISWLGTLLFLGHYREKPEAMIEHFERVLSYGRKRTIQETFAELDIQFPFRKRDIEQAAGVFELEFMRDLA